MGKLTCRTYGFKKRLITKSMVSMLAVGVCLSSAQARDNKLELNLEPQRTDAALLALGQNAKIQIMFSPAVAKTTQSPAISGTVSVEEALDLILDDTDLGYQRVSANLVVVKKKTEFENAATSTRRQAAPAAPALEDGSGDTGKGNLQEASAREFLEEVVVTGSRLSKSTFNSPTPTTVFGLADIEESGASDLSELLLEIPAINTDLSTSGSQLNTQNAGLSSVDLRHLGANRTLILIDGRRTVSNSGTANRVSLGTIPTGFVKRVEVITGGASAIYGSDAIAGVVNIITKDNTEGFKVDGRVGSSFAGGAEELTLNGSFGSKFADDRGYFLASFTFDKEYGLKATDRELALLQADYDYDDGVNEFETVTGDQPASEITQDDWADLSSYTPGGRFELNDFFYTEDGLVENGTINIHGYDLRQNNTLRIPRERFLGAAKVNYKVGETTEVFAQVQYAKIDTVSVREPDGFDYNDSFELIDPVTGAGSQGTVGRISLDNPFAPQVIIDEASSSGIRWGRRFTEVGQKTNVNDRETLRLWTGARGEVLDGWNWEVSYGYGQFKQHQERRNEVNYLSLINALDTEGDGAGGFQCASADARADGCIPINLFGVGSITTEMADYIRADLTLDTTVKQHNVLAYMAGDLFELPAGAVGVAVGIEYRKDQQELIADELSNFGGASAAPIPSFAGSYDVVEGFIETSIPLITGQPGFENLSLDASLRIADYSQPNVDTVVSYRAGLNWRPVEDIMFRAQFARAQRAPDLTELFSPPRGDFDSVNDICDGVDATTVGTVADNCRSDAGIAAAIAANGFYEQETSSTFSPNAGNLDLEEETADTWTLGVSFTPSALPGLSLAVDYYNIKVNDAISEYSNGDILEQCYGDADTFGSSNFFCNQISRDAEGQLSQIVQRVFNLNELRSEGIDTALQYKFDVGSIPGSFDMSAIYSYLIAYEQRFTNLDGTEGVERFDGELQSGAPKHEARFTFGWKNDEWRLRWRVNYFGSVVDSHEFEAAYLAELESNPAAELPLYLYISDSFEHDFYVSYTPEWLDKNMKFYGGVNNIFNNTGPFLPTGATDSGRNSNYNRHYDSIGRFGYIGMSVNF